MNNYAILPEGILSFCHGKLQNGNITKANSVEVIQCCLDSCKDHINFCYDECGSTYGPKGYKADFWQYDRCSGECDDLVGNCQSVCLEYPSPGLDNIKNCADIVCGDNKDCISSKREEILDCCKERCQGNIEVDCNDCDFFYDNFLKGVNLSSLKKNVKGTFPSKTHSLLWLLVLGIMLIGMIVMIRLYKN